jgi:hypothetical protein
MARITRHARPAREHPRVVVTCAYVDPATEIERVRARLRPRLRVSALGNDPHPGAPFVVVELEEPPAAPSRATSARLGALAADPPALRAFTRKVLHRQWGR